MNALTMIHLPLNLPALVAAGREQGHIGGTWSVETGYLVHGLLARLWQAAAPKPFDLDEAQSARGTASAERWSDRTLPLLAYTRASLDELHTRAAATGDPTRYAFDWKRAGQKAVPSFAPGQRLGFRVRLCPVVRVGRQHPRFRPGAEVDPYLAMVQRALASAERDRGGALPGARTDEIVAGLPPREAVYREWLARQLGPAVELVGTRLVAMRDARLWRRGQPGPGKAGEMHRSPRAQRAGRTEIGRRDITVEGELSVTAPEAFTALLARGIGRHRAFGFGMLLLRPPGSPPC